jgi:hypothetical protein
MNENIEIVQLLLTKADSSAVREALLVAIFMGHTYIAESILYHPQYKLFNDKKFMNATTDSFWQPQAENSQFSPDITPIMLAAQYNRTQIVQMLMLNGDRIEKPHEFFCKCNECSNRFKFDSLRHAQSRLNAYRGIASESYISLGSIDPILTSFELAFELKILADKEKYFKVRFICFLNFIIILLVYDACRAFCLMKKGKMLKKNFPYSLLVPNFCFSVTFNMNVINYNYAI